MGNFLDENCITEGFYWLRLQLLLFVGMKLLCSLLGKCSFYHSDFSELSLPIYLVLTEFNLLSDQCCGIPTSLTLTKLELTDLIVKSGENVRVGV